MSKINWGIIGLGNIAQKFLESFSEVNNANLVAIASNNNTRLNQISEKFNIKKNFIFNDYESLIKCKDVDIVYISLPNSLHFYWTTKCIENKKKFLVEKPATLNFDEASRLKNLVENKNLFFAEGFMYRHDPLILKMIELIRNNEIGNLLSLESSFGVNILTKKKFFFFNKKKKIDKSNRQFSKHLGGGCILDLGCYPTSLTILIASLMPNIDLKNFQIKVLKREIGETGVDINSAAEIIFENGFKSIVKASFKYDFGNSTIIKGSKGEINITNTFVGISEIKLISRNKNLIIKKKPIKSIYAIEIENISQDILNRKTFVSFPGMQIGETYINMKLLDNWLHD